MARERPDVHPTAIIDAGADVGSNTRIWHWTHISQRKRKIGRNCSIGQNVYVAQNVKIGDGGKIQNNVSVYEGVILEEGVFCGPSMVFTNVHNPRSGVVRKAEYRRTLVRRGATLGANCTIICRVKMGEFAFVGAGAVVTHDVKPYALMVGVPARQIGWMSRHGHRLDMPLEGSGSGVCPETGEEYRLLNGVLAPL